MPANSDEETQGQRLNPTIPDWLKALVKQDAKVVGKGEKAHAGHQRVCNAALLMYFAVEESMRRRIARNLYGLRDRESMESDLYRHPIARLIELASQLPEDQLEKLVKQVERRLAG